MNIINCISGLENIGNTCYLNVIIQLLNNIDELRQIAFDNNILNKIKLKKNKDKRLTIEFFNLLKKMNIETTIVKPLSFKTRLDLTNEDFYGYSQHDCCEFLIYLLNNIHVNLSSKVSIKYSGTPQNLRDRLYIKSLDIWSQHFNNEYSIIVPLLYGQNKITMKNKINKNNYLFECYNIISLPIINCLTLYDCFDKFIEKENINDHNEYILKYERLWRLPKYLFIQLKRFHNNKKLNDFISFPLNNLDLKNYSDSYEKNDCIYNLIGVVHHYGNIHFGHYISFIKDEENKWFCCNDETISKITDFKKIMNNDAYLLLYQKNI
jgi:ubiquitin carboxyl-terminal hydrolase 8